MHHLKSLFRQYAPIRRQDGRLADPVRQHAAIVEDLHEISPKKFGEASEPSRFYVLYDQDIRLGKESR